MASDGSQALSDALQRAEEAEREISEYSQRFTIKYGIDQIDLIQQLNELKLSLIDDEKQLILNKEEIHRNNEVIKQSYHELNALKLELLSDPIFDGEDFRLMMRKYFSSIKIECLSIKSHFSTEEKWDRVIAPNYKLSTEQLRNIRNLFMRDMRFGLNKNINKRNRSSLKMLKSLIYSLPNNDEEGIYYSMDWEGTNFRVLRLEFKGHQRLLQQFEMKPILKISEKYKKTKDYKELFDFLALTVKKYMINKFATDIARTNVYHIDNDNNIIKIPLEEDDDNINNINNQYLDDDDMDDTEDEDDEFDDFNQYKQFNPSRYNQFNQHRNINKKKEEIDYRYPMGFTFSFPIKQNKINEGILMEWTKGFDIPNVVGMDIAKLMQESFDKYNIPLRIDAVCNDTVGTLLTTSFEKLGVRVGCILGDGTNASYIDPKKGNQIINIEWGAFNKGLPRQPMTDFVMDSYTINPGMQYAEKMISAQYLGELVRLLSLDVFGDKIRKYGNKTILNNRWGLTSSIVSNILEQFDQQNMSEIYRILRMDIGLQEFTGNDGKLFVYICRVIVNRSADLSSTLLLGVLEKTGLFKKIKGKELYVLNEQFKRKCVVGIDGSVWKKVPRFQQRMKNTMQKIVNKKIADRIRLVNAYDGGGKGAALAVITNHQYIREQQYRQKKYD